MRDNFVSYRNDSLIIGLVPQGLVYMANSLN